MKASGGGLLPVDEQSADVISKWPIGQGVRVDVKRMRNIRFHRRFFALLNIGFDAWEPDLPDHNGMPTQKNYERFRKDCIIAAGFYEPVVNLKGEVRAEADSISFAAMDDAEFEKVYSAVANVLLQKVLRNYTRSDLDEVVNQIIGFC